MGIIRGGVLGGFRKKTGAVVGAYWRTLDVIRGLPRLSGKAPTSSQVDQRFIFGMVTGFVSWISDLIAVGFTSSNGVNTPMNEAVSYNLLHAVTGTSPDFTIDYAKFKFSYGRLKLPRTIEVTAAEGGELNYSWFNSSPTGLFLNPTDKATLMVYNPVKDEFVSQMDVEERSAGACSLQLPTDFAGDLVHCYLSFNSTLNKGLVSKSVYLGEVEIL